jgi:hypothetical protein
MRRSSHHQNHLEVWIGESVGTVGPREIRRERGGREKTRPTTRNVHLRVCHNAVKRLQVPMERFHARKEKQCPHRSDFKLSFSRVTIT